MSAAPTIVVNPNDRITLLDFAENISNILTSPLSLAVWAMDDGNGYGIKPAFRLNSYGFGYEGNVLLDEVYSTKLKNYGQCYESYRDIHSGQLMYYIDPATAVPFINVNFPTSSQVDHVLFKDPQGAIKPQYERTPLTQWSMYKTDPNTTQWSSDSQYQRQSIMASQIRPMLEKQYTTRWMCYH